MNEQRLSKLKTIVCIGFVWISFLAAAYGFLFKLAEVAK